MGQLWHHYRPWKIVATEVVSTDRSHIGSTNRGHHSKEGSWKNKGRLEVPRGYEATGGNGTLTRMSFLLWSLGRIKSCREHSNQRTGPMNLQRVGLVSPSDLEPCNVTTSPIHVLLKPNTERIDRSKKHRQGPSINIFPTTLQDIPTVPEEHMVKLGESFRG